jgi:hypothetical protein
LALDGSLRVTVLLMASAIGPIKTSAEVATARATLRPLSERSPRRNTATTTNAASNTIRVCVRISADVTKVRATFWRRVRCFRQSKRQNGSEREKARLRGEPKGATALGKARPKKKE